MNIPKFLPLNLNLNVQARLIFGFLAMAVLLMIAISTTVWKVNTISERSDRIVDLRVPTAAASANMVNNINASLAALRGWMLTGNESFKKQRAAVWRDIDSVSADLDRLSRNWTNPANVEKWNGVKATLKEFRAAQAQVEAIAHSADEQPASKILFTEAVPLAAVMFTEITNMINNEFQQGASAARKDLLGIMADVRGSTAISLANIRAYLLSGDVKFKEAFEASWAKNVKRFADLDTKSSLFTSAQRRAFDAYSAAHKEFSPLPPRMFEIRGSNKWNMANYTLVTEAAPRAGKILAVLAGEIGDDGSRKGGMVANQKRLLNTDADESSNDIGTLLTIGWVLLGVGLVSATVIIPLTSRSIVTPIAAMTSAMGTLAEGDNSVEIPATDRKDEIGEMAKAVLVFKENGIERTKAEEALRQSEKKYRDFVDGSFQAIIIHQQDKIVYANPAAAELYQYDLDQLIGLNPDKLIHPDELYLVRERRKRPPTEGREGRRIRQDGTEFWTYGTVRKVQWNDEPAHQITALDVTELKQAEEALRKSETQLQQAQKMQAVGQLTGGVAHDFNNILAIVLGNLELTEERLKTGEDVGPLLANAVRATRRGADLTQRLLAYSRQQVLAPKAVNLGETIVGMAALLRSTLGEYIEIETVGADDLWVCQADPSQVENALLNLALNARDAMPTGGKLTVETANVYLDDDYAAAQADVKPGEFVMLAVTDEGIGMSQEIVDRIYEPFFTTKEVGEGSGLGLSMIYGFVKQSGGHMTVFSEVGVGTTFKIYLPRSPEFKRDAIEDGPVDPELTAREETVFIIEDDPDLRTLAIDLLSSLGYQVMDAGSGAAALELLKQERHFDLLLTDVILPGGMSGPQLVEVVQRERPGTKVLFMSGYTEMAMAQGVRLDETKAFLQKPFLKQELATKVREVLDTAA